VIEDENPVRQTRQDCRVDARRASAGRGAGCPEPQNIIIHAPSEHYRPAGLIVSLDRRKLIQPEGADPKEFLARWDEINEIVFAVVHDLGGSIAAEHGIGQLTSPTVSIASFSLSLSVRGKALARSA